eukprot:3619589-Prymnesium_polylepis.1
MDALHRTMAQLNAHADAVVALATAQRSIWLLHSLESHHASETFPIGVLAAVEALTFLGVPFGFVPSDGD